MFANHWVRMASDSILNNLERYKQDNHSAFVLGYTGECGKALVKELAKDKLFRKVVLIGRREVPLPADVGPEFEQRIVDFENLDQHADTFTDLDVGFCCIGTTRKKSGAKGFVRVDHDYVLKSAEIAKSKGCTHFQLISSMGADKNSWFLYTKTKGQVEEDIKDLQFDRFSVFRPSLLLADRQEPLPGEKIVKCLMTPIIKLAPTLASIPVEVLARAMINNVVTPGDKTQELYKNAEIHAMSARPKESANEERTGAKHNFT